MITYITLTKRGKFMKNRVLKHICFLLAAVVFLSALSIITLANEDTVELSIISANVSGIPSYLTKYDRDVKKCQETLGKMLNESGHDIICVQEDFQYHTICTSLLQF